MMQRIRNAMGKLKEEKGFTLVEMALVLIIIGIIIGAIVKGKDLVRGAEQKRIYSKFVNGWRLAYLNFYDRTGRILGDTWNGTAAGQDGQADTSNGTGAAPTAAGQAALSNGTPPTFMGVADVGLDIPVSNVPGSPFQYNYVNSAGNTNSLDVSFTWDTTGGNTRNVMVINNVPAELAMALDTMIDGSADGAAGDFIRSTGAAWDVTTPVTVNTAYWIMQF
jgi:prepilin-type N-terminal cleavage/methylation domain-containing protein